MGEALAKESEALIGTWLPIDADELRPLIEQFLLTAYENGADVLPNEANTDRFLHMGMSWAGAGFPTLHAVIDGKICSWLAWGPAMQNFESKHPNTIHAAASYTLPEYRSHGVQGALKQRAIEMSKELGATRIFGPMLIDNERGMVEMEKFGARKTHIQMELEI